METAEETAEERAKEYIKAVFDKICMGHSEQLEKDLVLLLKVQDRITRHACAESITIRCSIFDQGLFRAVNVNEAQAAIMNTKAI